MQSNPGTSRLLDDILMDEDTMRCRGEVEATCLRHMKERRRRIVLVRTMRIAAGILVFCIGSYLIAHHFGKVESVAMVATEDLEGEYLAVERFSTEVAGLPAQLPFHTATPGSSGERDKAERISEQEVLEHFLGHPLALVRRPGEHAELVFLDPADDARFFAGRLQSQSG